MPHLQSFGKHFRSLTLKAARSTRRIACQRLEVRKPSKRPIKLPNTGCSPFETSVARFGDEESMLVQTPWKRPDVRWELVTGRLWNECSPTKVFLSQKSLGTASQQEEFAELDALSILDCLEIIAVDYSGLKPPTSVGATETPNESNNLRGGWIMTDRFSSVYQWLSGGQHVWARLEVLKTWPLMKVVCFRFFMFFSNLRLDFCGMKNTHLTHHHVFFPKPKPYVQTKMDQEKQAAAILVLARVSFLKPLRRRPQDELTNTNTHLKAKETRNC